MKPSLLVLLAASMACTVVPPAEDFAPLDAAATAADTGGDPDAGGTGDATATLDAAAPPVCISDPGASACWLCEDAHCCGEEQACAASSACGAYQKCLVACGKSGKTNAQCVIGCDAQQAAGHGVYAPKNACVVKNCLAPCAIGTPDSCSVCTHDACGDEHAACQADAICEVIDSCFTECLAQPNQKADVCSGQCASGRPAESNKRFQGYLGCLAVHCMQCT